MLKLYSIVYWPWFDTENSTGQLERLCSSHKSQSSKERFKLLYLTLADREDWVSISKGFLFFQFFENPYQEITLTLNQAYVNESLIK